MRAQFRKGPEYLLDLSKEAEYVGAELAVVPRYWTKQEIVRAIRMWSTKHGGLPPTMRQWAGGGDDWPSANTVQKRFGSWNKAVAAAGFVPRSAWTEPSVREPQLRVALMVEYDLHRAIAQAAEANGTTITSEVRDALRWRFLPDD